MPTRTSTLPAEEAPVQLSQNQAKKIAIIGGGASGAIVLDSLIKEGHAEEIVLFERRDTFGGVWVYDDKLALESVPVIKPGATRAELDPPLENPFNDLSLKENIYRAGNSGNSGNPGRLRLLPLAQERYEATPAYEKMKTNIIENMMTYSDEKHWGAAPGAQFAERALVQQYITRYIERHQHHDKVRVEMCTTVEDVARVPRVGTGVALGYAFRVTLRNRLADGTDQWWQEQFDSVVVATGHYHVPHIPEVPGSRLVQEKYPGVFEHAKFFTNGAKYAGKTVVVVGSRALGTDLTRFTADHAARVYQLVRSIESTKKLLRRANVEVKPAIARFVERRNDEEDGQITGFDVVFEDGTVVPNPDYVLYATGYQFLYPFLQRELGDITRDGAIVPRLYQHTFLSDEPLISIVGVPTDAISFRAFEFQAILLARFLAGKVALPPVPEQEQWLQQRAKVHGKSRAFHTIGAQEARNYMCELARLGELKNPQDLLGRRFPVTTEAEVAEYVRAATALRDSWD